ncbi:MAG: response regulator [Candidatus Marinimicrobia bacterium]|nr:response regulator [Candidatus Neomarinimicrobiota bacterium]
MQLIDTRVLIVEDEIVVASEIKLRLEALGFQVIGIVNNGRDAIAEANEHYPDIILMDITLKGKMNGLDATREISRETDIPVIFITAHTDTPTLDSAREASSHGIFTKPFSDDELMVAIQQATISKVMTNYLEAEDKRKDDADNAEGEMED